MNQYFEIAFMWLVYIGIFTMPVWLYFILKPRKPKPQAKVINFRTWYLKHKLPYNEPNPRSSQSSIAIISHRLKNTNHSMGTDHTLCPHYHYEIGGSE